jgi:glycosyltransferase involved in cell wall biosynthesis
VAEPGISVVVLSYERPRALAELLRALLAQELGDLGLELLLCNNSPDVRLEASAGSEVGDLLSRLPDVKVFNSSHNWLCRVRYTIATLARHETIFFIDDDLAPADRTVVRDLYDALAELGPADIVSCWTALWTEWNDRSLTKVRMGFTRAQPTELTECDYVGPGICMFRKRILFHPAILDPPPERWRSDSGWFPWITAMELGSRKYYVPTHGRFRIHEEHRHAALGELPGFRTELYAAYKEMWKRGYEPVLGRKRDRPRADSPEMKAARSLPPETDLW